MANFERNFGKLLYYPHRSIWKLSLQQRRAGWFVEIPIFDKNYIADFIDGPFIRIEL